MVWRGTWSNGGSAMKTKLSDVAARHCSVMKTIIPSLCAACSLLIGVGSGPTNAATVTYTSATAYFADVGPQSLQNFNSPISNTATSIKYNNLVVSCSGSGFCASPFFGTSVSIDGLSVFSTSPSLVTFTFNSPITSFGIFIAGLGTVSPGSTTFSIANSNGFSSNLFSNYSGTTTSFDSSLFAGLISDTRFTSVTLAGTEVGDGVFLDNLSYGHSHVSGAPLLAALPLFATGLGGMGLLGWWRKRKNNRKNSAAIAAA
jgi:hypothetical protein